MQAQSKDFDAPYGDSKPMFFDDAGGGTGHHVQFLSGQAFGRSSITFAELHDRSDGPVFEW
jgi:hypothetical protein